MTVTISAISSTNPARNIFSFTWMLKSRRATASRRHDQDVAAVEHRHGHQVEQPEVQADRRHQAQRAPPSPPAPTRRRAARCRPDPSAACGDVSPMIRPHSVFRISPENSMLRWTLRPIASSGPGWKVRVSFAMAMPMRPTSPSRGGRHREVCSCAVAPDAHLDRLFGAVRDDARRRRARTPRARR